MDTMNRQQLSQLRGQAAQLIRKYRIPLLVFLLGVALVLIPSRTKKEEPQQTSAEAAETDFNLSATQKQLETLLSAIDGAGRVRLMLTLSSGERIVYQTDSRTVTTSGSTTQETQTVFRQPGPGSRWFYYRFDQCVYQSFYWCFTGSQCSGGQILCGR